MATYIITGKFYMDGDPDLPSTVKGWVEEELRGGAYDFTINSITQVPDEEEE